MSEIARLMLSNDEPSAQSQLSDLKRCIEWWYLLRNESCTLLNA